MTNIKRLMRCTERGDLTWHIFTPNVGRLVTATCAKTGALYAIRADAGYRTLSINRRRRRVRETALDCLARAAYRNALSVPGEPERLSKMFAGGFQEPWVMARIAEALEQEGGGGE